MTLPTVVVVVVEEEEAGVTEAVMDGPPNMTSEGELTMMLVSLAALLSASAMSLIRSRAFIVFLGLSPCG